MTRTIKPAIAAAADSPVERIAVGTIVYTLDGALPVEFLSVGDRVVTRAGARALRRISGCCQTGFALGFDRPEIVYAEGAMISVA